MKCIVLIAAPAAGKGTISKYIEENYNYKHVSAGDLLREEVRKNTALGKEIKDLIDRGSLVSDDIIEKVFENVFKDMDTNLILDGMPRTLKQAKMLDRIEKKYDNFSIDTIIYIDVLKEIAIDRIKNRLICDNCKSIYNKQNIKTEVCTKCGGNLISRDDDEMETFLNRYDTFLKETKPLLNYYKDKVKTIYNNSTLEEMYKNVDDLLKGDE